MGRFKCDVCGKRFYCESYLDTHRKLHADSSAFACDACGKKFAAASSLADHVKRVHENKFLNVCSICGKEIKSGTLTLKEHMARAHHIGKPSRLCEFCNKGFYSANELKRHILRAHRGHDFKKPCPF